MENLCVSLSRGCSSSNCLQYEGLTDASIGVCVSVSVCVYVCVYVGLRVLCLWEQTSWFGVDSSAQ